MDTRILFISFLLLVHYSLTQVVPVVPVVSTDIGIIRGVRSDDGDYNMFMGIPYGKVNETNPFATSTPYPQFDGIFEANDDSSVCPQQEPFNNTVVGEIDCLRLNVYTPSHANPNSRLPVLVWIYGGGFITGSYGRFLYGPKYLVRHDIILVTINYRVNVFGFMCLDIPEVSGNQGLKDQLIALKWVQSHISAFGGDPNQVTVSGNSAGSMSIDLHLHTNKSNGLFNKATFQSGTSFTLAYFPPEKNAPMIYAKYFGFETEDIYEAIHFLSEIDPRDIIIAQSELNLVIYPCIEKEFEGVEGYLTMNWVNMTVPAVKNIPMIVGVTDDEFGTERLINSGREFWVESYLNRVFDINHKDFYGMSDLFSQFYLGDEELGPDTGFADLASDIMFVHPTFRTVDKFLENNAGNIYFYIFSHVGERNFLRSRNNLTIGGVLHGEDTSYLFDMELLPEEPNVEDQLVIDRMTEMWSNFVKYGNPTPQTTYLLNVKWEPIVGKDSPFYCMAIDSELFLVTRPWNERRAFLDVFFETNKELMRIWELDSRHWNY